MKKGIISVTIVFACSIIGASVLGKLIYEKIEKIQKMSDKHLALFFMMNQWVKIKNEGKNLEKYFMREGYRNIAIYGMSYVGETLISELKNTSINIIYGIDKNVNYKYSNFNIVSLDEKLQSVDAIVVTAIAFFEEIKKELSSKIDCPIVSLEDILYEI